MRLIDADTLMQAVNEEASFIEKAFREDAPDYGKQRLNELTRIKVLIVKAPTILTRG